MKCFIYPLWPITTGCLNTRHTRLFNTPRGLMQTERDETNTRLWNVGDAMTYTFTFQSGTLSLFFDPLVDSAWHHDNEVR